jgi:hypothetical protein
MYLSYHKAVVDALYKLNFRSYNVRLECLLAMFLPFNLAAQVLLQLTGISVSDDAIWEWIQRFGQADYQRIRLVE